MINARRFINLFKKCSINPFLGVNAYRFSSVKISEVYKNEISPDIKYNNNAQNKSCLFSYREFNCGQLNAEHVDKYVKLTGYVEYIRLNKFMILRDAYGSIQLISEDNRFNEVFEKINYESIVEIEGVVKKRPKNMINTNMKTGDIEIEILKIELVNLAKKNLPFNIREYQKANEYLRMKYRYLDLRFPEIQQNLRHRSTILMKMREYLIHQCDFVDVETPTLFRPTPGGAKEFLVMSPIPKHYYALVQSPQQLKQILMAGGIDRYFQIAKCYRDEGSRPDRQIEFTQLDIEMSYVNVNGIMALIENVIRHSWPENLLGPLKTSFRKMTYSEALEKYGSDKPDLRFDNQIINCDDIFSDSQFTNARVLVFSDFSNSFTHKVRNELTKLSLSFPDVKFVNTKLQNNIDDWIKNMTKLWPENISMNLIKKLNLCVNDVVLFASGKDKRNVLKFLGKVLSNYVNPLKENQLKISKNQMEFVWISEFPLFEKDANGDLQSTHHPFTMPENVNDLYEFGTDLLRLKGLSYDLVLNGNEIGGGSIRIHDANLQRDVLRLLKINEDQLAHLLDALESGCPPHGGFAIGLDRYLSIVLNTNSIRDVIAFPKTVEGRDPLSNAPIEIN